MKRAVGKEANRAFPVIFAAAQHTLRTTFGFELVEMRARGAENPLLKEQALELDKRSSNKRQRVDETQDSRKHSSSSSAQAYLLRSVLPASVRQVLTNSDQDDARPLIEWGNHNGELGSMGLLFILLSLILLSGRQASEGTHQQFANLQPTFEVALRNYLCLWIDLFLLHFRQGAISHKTVLWKFVAIPKSLH